MPPKGGNAKKESGRAKKAENESKKQETVAADKVSSCTDLFHWLNYSYVPRSVRRRTSGRIRTSKVENPKLN